MSKCPTIYIHLSENRALSEVIDIIHRLTFELTGGEKLGQVSDELKKQVKVYADLDKQVRQYETNLKTAAKDDIQLQKRLTAEIERTKKARESALNAVKTSITSNKQLQDAIKQEIGLIQRLEERIETLNAKRRLSNDPRQIKAYGGQISQTKAELAGLLKNDKGALGGLFSSSSLLQGALFGSGFGLAAQGISEVRQFLIESAKVYKEVEGIRIAFNRLNQPDLLDNLREATRGTLSDLELMKYAVQANNFEVPLDRIAGLFGFARQRARETGESVDYLVKSVIIGIGRESPKILDNLGINVRKVREEFNRTGDYATAVFNIIEEQGKAAGGTIDTLADSIDRLNAKIENAQAKIGKEVAEATLLGKAAFIDLLNTITHPFDLDKSLLFGDTYLEAANKQIEQTHELAEQEQAIADQANKVYLNSFDKFFQQYKTSDYNGRQVILTQAKDMYDQLYKVSEAGLLNLQALNQAYFGRFLKGAGKSQFSITGKAKTPIYQLIGFTEEELRDAKQKVDQYRMNLRAMDVGGISEANKYEDEIDRLLAIITGKKVKPIRTNKKSPVKKLKEETKEAEFEMKQLTFSIEEAVKALQALDDPKFKLPDAIKAFSDGNIKEVVRKGSKKYRREKLIFGDKADEPDQHKRRISYIKDEIDAYQLLTNAAVNAANTIYDAQVRSLDAEIRAREKRVEIALKLAERGNTETLKLEQKRMDETIKKREEIARRQVVINAALATSEAIVAVATAATRGEEAIVLIPAIIAAIIAGYAAVSAATQESTSDNAQFFKGGYTGDGNPHAEAGTVHKREFVMPDRVTSKPENRAILEAMYRGEPIPHSPNFTTVNNGYATKMGTKNIESKLDSLIEATMASETKVNTRLDAEGFLVATTRKNKHWAG